MIKKTLPTTMKVSPFFKDKIKLEAVKKGLTIVKYTELLASDEKETVDQLKKSYEKKRRSQFDFRF